MKFELTDMLRLFGAGGGEGAGETCAADTETDEKAAPEAKTGAYEAQPEAGGGKPRGGESASDSTETEPEVLRIQPAQPATLRSHLDGLLRQAEELRQTVPDFDLWAELKSADFARMTAPGAGVSVKRAYYAMHHEELSAAAIKAAEEAAAQRLASAIEAGQRRPQENGAAAAAPAVAVTDWRNATPEQLAAQRRAIKAAAARGEKLYPPGV